jgi:hypothetical protein
MGLDLYACTTTQAPPGQVDFEASEATQFHYWRKHPNLHGWMEQLHRDKDGSQNSVNVQLTVADLDDLEFAIKATVLPHTTGFFFGASDGSERDDDLAFIVKARGALTAGKSIFYTSW